MSNPTNEDFEEIAELLFQSWRSTEEKSTMEDSEKEPAYGPGGDEDLNNRTSYGALKKRKKKTNTGNT